MAIKELLDNSLDACEESHIAPTIKILVNEAGIEVSDNGPGLPARVIEGILDFSLRVSSREAYVSPTGGHRAMHSKPFWLCRLSSMATAAR